MPGQNVDLIQIQCVVAPVKADGKRKHQGGHRNGDHDAGEDESGGKRIDIRLRFPDPVSQDRGLPSLNIPQGSQKKENPGMVATKGLYRMVRCPNYLGELTFWTGIFIGSWGALNHWGQWVMAVLAWISIIIIMFNGAQRLEKRQMKRYAGNAEYKAYADTTPIIIPFLPIYHLNKTE